MKTEQVLHLPSMLHKDDASNRLFAEFEAFVGQVTAQKYIFLSKLESIVVEEDHYEKEAIPPNVDLIYIKIEGPTSFVEVKNRTQFRNFNDVTDRSFNSITIQGPNPVSVRGLATKVQQQVERERFILRTVLYRFPLLWFWSTLVLLWLGEYRVLKLVRPHVTLSTPLSGIGLIALLATALGTMIVYANILLKVFTYWFPFFEIEDNVASHRKRAQKTVGTILVSLVVAGLLNVLALLFLSGK